MKPAPISTPRAARAGAGLLDLGSQAWLTGVDSNLFDAFGAAIQRVHVEDGHAERVR
jgi:hypothetical protein